jgi:hypothetical protein
MVVLSCTSNLSFMYLHYFVFEGLHHLIHNINVQLAFGISGHHWLCLPTSPKGWLVLAIIECIRALESNTILQLFLGHPYGHG